MRLRFVPTITLCFNPRTRVGCDAIILPAWSPVRSFQSTHPRGVRRLAQMFQRERSVVSIHAPAWGATSSGRWIRCWRPGFNPRTRVGCDPGGVPPRGSLQKVSIHAPAWGATRLRLGSRLRRFRFNPRTRVGCDENTEETQTWPVGFNPRTRVGCDGKGAGPTVRNNQFQSTHPRGVRQVGAPSDVAVTGFQSTHPRGVRLAAGIAQGRLRAVSIHAPAWGATSGGTLRRGSNGVSIHAPAWGATCPQDAHSPQQEGFNPRTRVGCDSRATGNFRRSWTFQSTHPRGVRPVHGSGRLDDGFVSIHAPAWGATPAPPTWYRQTSFQSTHPRGVRRNYFWFWDGVLGVSIHAPAWGATGLVITSCPAQQCVSIHAPAWGATSTTVLRNTAAPWVSIHAPAWGATVASAKYLFVVRVFQSTHPRGVRHNTRKSIQRLLSFNPRTRVGCDGASLDQFIDVGLFQSTHPRGVRPSIVL